MWMLLSVIAFLVLLTAYLGAGELMRIEMAANDQPVPERWWVRAKQLWARLIAVSDESELDDEMAQALSDIAADSHVGWR